MRIIGIVEDLFCEKSTRSNQKVCLNGWSKCVESRVKNGQWMSTIVCLFVVV